ncbi:MAG: DUF3141 domain-containing protein [Chloroflexaceae bacterium]|jgi:hypothetical protein|nr:DUF3141 domain-containing protein [Chloroflexaceae bacterium]
MTDTAVTFDPLRTAQDVVEYCVDVTERTLLLEERLVQQAQVTSAEFNTVVYDYVVKPMVAPFVPDTTTAAMRDFYKQNHLFSDLNPFVAGFKAFIPLVKEYRHPAPPDNPLLKFEQETTKNVATAFNNVRHFGDNVQELVTTGVQGGIGAFFGTNGTTAPVAATPVEVVEVPFVEPAAGPVADRLTDINGIGASYAKKLNDGGIFTFAALAACTPEQVLAIIKPAAWQKLDVASWIEQARAFTEV